MATQENSSNIFGDKWPWIVLLAIILVGVGLRLYCFRGMWGTDDGEYARLANAMARGNFGAFVQENYVDKFNAPAQLPFRIGLIFPLAVLFRFFGVSETTLVFYPLVISVAGVAVAFLCGRFLFNVKAGLIAAALWSVLPIDVESANYFLPDGIASFYGSLGVLVILLMISSDAVGTFRKFLGGFVAGLLFGISWLSKESIVYLVPFCLILLAIDLRKNFKDALPLWIGIAVASGGVLSTEMLTHYVSNGDFFLHMHETERSHVQSKSYLFYEGSRFGWPVGGSHMKALIKRLFLDGPSTIFLNPHFLFLPIVGLLAAAHAFYWRDRSFFIPALWMLTLAFMFNFASASFSSYTPLVLYDRYLHPLMLPATVLTAGFLTKLIAADHQAAPATTHGERFFWGMVMACLVASTSLYFGFRQVRDVSTRRPIYEIRDVAAMVKSSERVYSDPLSSKALEFLWGYPQGMRIVNYEGMRAEDIEPNSFVLVDKVRLDWLKVNVSMWLTKDYGYHEPEFASRPPESWKKVWQNDHASLYRVDSLKGQ